MNDAHQQGSYGLIQSEASEVVIEPLRRRQTLSVVVACRSVLVPVEVQLGVVLVKVGVLSDDAWMCGGKLRAHPFHRAGKIQHAEQNQNQTYTEFHGQPGTGGDDEPKQDDGCADDQDRQGVSQSPKSAY